MSDLIRDQHPDLADRPARLGALGWGNQLWRLGDDLAVRLPWHDDTDTPLHNEYAWLPTLAPRLPLPITVKPSWGTAARAALARLN